jgi:hypothetical protein
MNAGLLKDNSVGQISTHGPAKGETLHRSLRSCLAVQPQASDGLALVSIFQINNPGKLNPES